MYVGVDVHKRVCRAAMVNEEGELVDEFSFRNSSRGIEDFMMKIEAFKDRVLVAVESTGNLSIDRSIVIIGVAPGVAVFYDAGEFYNVLETMSKLGKDPAALRAEDVAKFLKEAEILTIPPVQQECLKDYDKLSKRLNNLVDTTLHDLNRLETRKSLTGL